MMKVLLLVLSIFMILSAISIILSFFLFVPVVSRSKKHIVISSLNKVVSLISDAGTPTIADPGQIVVNQCLKNNIVPEYIHFLAP